MIKFIVLIPLLIMSQPLPAPQAQVVDFGEDLPNPLATFLESFANRTREIERDRQLREQFQIKQRVATEESY